MRAAASLTFHQPAPTGRILGLGTLAPPGSGREPCLLGVEPGGGRRGIRFGVDFACVFVETPSSRVSVTLVEESVVLTFGKKLTAGEYKAKSRNPSLPSHHHQ